MNGYSDLINDLPRPDLDIALRKSYHFIEAFILARGYPPTIFEIAEGTNSTYATARARLVKMEHLRWLSRDSRLRSIELKGIQMDTPAELTYNALLELADRLAVAMAGHERAAQLFEFFGEAYHVEGARLRMEAQLVEAERLGQQDAIPRL